MNAGIVTFGHIRESYAMKYCSVTAEIGVLDSEAVGCKICALAETAMSSHSKPTQDKNGCVTLLNPYIPIYSMVKTIRVSEEYHEWLHAHKESDETMEETLRRMTRGPHPDDVAGLLSEEEAADAKEAIDRLRGRDRDRLDTARSAFERESEDE